MIEKDPNDWEDTPKLSTYHYLLGALIVFMLILGVVSEVLAEEENKTPVVTVEAVEQEKEEEDISWFQKLKNMYNDAYDNLDTPPEERVPSPSSSLEVEDKVEEVKESVVVPPVVKEVKPTFDEQIDVDPPKKQEEAKPSISCEELKSRLFNVSQEEIAEVMKVIRQMAEMNYYASLKCITPSI